MWIDTQMPTLSIPNRKDSIVLPIFSNNFEGISSDVIIYNSDAIKKRRKHRNSCNIATTITFQYLHFREVDYDKKLIESFNAMPVLYLVI